MTPHTLNIFTSNDLYSTQTSHDFAPCGFVVRVDTKTLGTDKIPHPLLPITLVEYTEPYIEDVATKERINLYAYAAREGWVKHTKPANIIVVSAICEQNPTVRRWAKQYGMILVSPGAHKRDSEGKTIGSIGFTQTV